jgi:LacI family transcriptional regulator
MSVTRADVARAAGVSPALVSYVLNNGPRPVSAEARKRVLKAIDELKYRPNKIAQSLRGNRTHSIAMLMPDHLNPHFAELAQAVENESFTNDYMLMIGTANNDPTREQDYLHAFLDRQVDGLLLISATANPDVSRITDANIPVVLLDRAPPGSDFSTVVLDNRRAAHDAVQHLLQHGRERPLCISGPAEIEAVKQREAGWLDALEHAGVTAPPPVRSSLSREGGYTAMRTILASDAQPDSLFTVSDAQAIGAIRACTDTGHQVPDQISIVSFDGTEAGLFTQPPLTSVDQPVAAIARSAIDTLLSQIRDNDRTAVHQVLQGHLRLGRSCGCTTASSAFPMADRRRPPETSPL